MMPSYNVHGLFKFVLHHTCECVDRFLREERIDDRTSYLVLMGIANAQQSVRRSYSTIEVFGLEKLPLRAMDPFERC